MLKSWFLVQLKPGGLDRAVVNLRRQGHESFMPLREQTSRFAGRWKTTLRPLFPGYLFVEVSDDNPNWRSINATYGVSRIVSLEAGHPTRIDPDIISAMRARVDKNGKLRPVAELEVGDQVEVVSGPFANKLAEIEATPEPGRVYVLFELMGRYTRAVIPTTDVMRRSNPTQQRLA